MLGRMDKTHVNDLQAVVKKIVGNAGEEEQLHRERALLMQFLGVLGILGEKSALIKSRTLSPVGEFGRKH